MSKKTSNNAAPELRPTKEEFEHPIKYLSRPEIEKLGKQYGILKVIPPKGWKPNFSLDWDSFKFHTRIQRLHELNLRNRSRACFIEGFNCYLDSQDLQKLSTTDDLCLGVADKHKMDDMQIYDYYNGWIMLMSGHRGYRVHMHDIFLSKKFDNWYNKLCLDDVGHSYLEELSTYCEFLLGALKMEDPKDNSYNYRGDLVIPPDRSHSTLHELLRSPAALLKQPDNKLKLQKMRKRLITSLGKRGKKRSTLSGSSEEEIKFPFSPDSLNLEELEGACSVCYKKDETTSMLVCRGCKKAIHMKCFSVPLKKYVYRWYCGECLAGSTNDYAEYGFEEDFENKFSLNEFEEYCKKWEIEMIRLIKSGKILGEKIKLTNKEIDSNKLSEKTVEKLFWKLIDGEISIPNKLEYMKIRYGADIHNEKPGEVSGFPTEDNPKRRNEDDEYIKSEWNLNKLPFARGSLLDYICQSLSDENEKKNEKDVKNQISGMTVPWVYIGGPLSTFCWHKEDHFTLSANYSHLGAPKKWYGIASKDSIAFEELINKIAPEYEAKQKDLMHQLVSMVSPDEIRNKGKIEVYETVQHAGEFIITFPKVYHSGFNYGFNVNEAVNFTLPLWVPFSIPAVKEYENVGKECVFDTFKLLKKIYFDLNNDEGRRKWQEDTGISNDKITELLMWVNQAYNNEVSKFAKIVEDEELKKVMDKMKHVSVKEYTEEVKKGSGGGGDDDDDDDDDKLCKDCRTRVHFKWIVVDMYEEWKKQYEAVNGVIDDEGLEGRGEEHKDVESEWQSIIERAKQESLEEKEGEKTRRSSRKRKLSGGVKEELEEKVVEVEKDDEDDYDVGSKEMYAAIRALRLENGKFGKCVFCPGCLKEELQKVSSAGITRICNAGCVVYE